jgi:hypothetical protein
MEGRSNPNRLQRTPDSPQKVGLPEKNMLIDGHWRFQEQMIAERLEA